MEIWRRGRRQNLVGQPAVLYVMRCFTGNQCSNLSSGGRCICTLQLTTATPCCTAHQQRPSLSCNGLRATSLASFASAVAVQMQRPPLLRSLHRMPRYCAPLSAPPHRSADCARDVGRECGSCMPAQCYWLDSGTGGGGDTQRFKSIRNDQVTAGNFDCRDVGGSSELVPCAEDDDLRFVSV